MIITWEVQDGYCGGSRPQTTEINDIVLEDLDDEERQEYIEDAVQEDFEQTVTWAITSVDNE